MKRRPWLLTAVLAFLASPATSQTQSVRVQVIDVGQADGILIRTPNLQWVLIDAGQGSLLADSLPAHFGVDRLALAVGTHRHRDHIGGMDNVLNRIPAALYLGDTTVYASGQDDDRLRDTVTVRAIPVQIPGADTLEIDGVRFIILPPDPVDDANENDNSALVRLEFGEFSMLFTGDAEDAERDWLVVNHASLLDADVLKASHHGSRNGTSDTLCRAAPRVPPPPRGGRCYLRAGGRGRRSRVLHEPARDRHSVRLPGWPRPRPPPAYHEQVVHV
jgi:competence protein ComEC